MTVHAEMPEIGTDNPRMSRRERRAAEKAAKREAMEAAKRQAARRKAAARHKAAAKKKGARNGAKKPQPKEQNKRAISAQATIPYREMGKDGICRVHDRLYSKTIRYLDLNYQLAQPDDKADIFDGWSEFLNYFDYTIHAQLTFSNRHSIAAELENLIKVRPRNDGFSDLMEEYEKCFGVRPVQGAGVTEAAPVIAVNIPKSRMVTDWAPKQKDDSIGLPLYGMSVQIRNLDTGEPCRANEVGMLWISGINVMPGYFGEPEKTAEVLQNGWYCTGDLVRQDEDNFLFISGRLSRFAKIGGEMVPHEGLEDVLNQILGNNGESEPKICVTSVPDEKKGEKLVVLFTELSMTPEELNAALLEQKYPPIWIPNVDAYFPIDAIPLLGTGKLDLCAIREKALELAK